MNYPCSNHASVKGNFFCVSCHHNFCRECIKLRDFGEMVAYICPKCGGRCDDFEELSNTITEERKSTDPIGQLSKVFAYPFAGEGKQRILIASLIYALPAFCFAGGNIIFGILTSVVITLWTLIIFITVIESSAISNNESPPDLPDLFHVEHWFARSFILAVVMALCFVPLVGLFQGRNDFSTWIWLVAGVFLFPIYAIF